ncbi:DUF397 domain-containing protein [Planomonospora venezuelensis]|uniref:DUF397 domain-containing protein n=1 Tax=Planomonospora venezuelensis TaxID=1999 RepID=A0A841CXN3_PLAVE|nr:DUF397 domain-containing protein [Planomonospora venezuelensis]MBB5962170.1 hypothetical protein [Planomonospora venezuelensis]GIN00934.1 hypothetical protein Pve01_25920 [Planomonospora venezuelensis]
MEADLSGAIWRRAVPDGAGDDGGNCVEVAVVDAPGTGHKAGLGPLYVLRDSRDPEGPKLFFTQSEWDAFVGGVRLGEFDV